MIDTPTNTTFHHPSDLLLSTIANLSYISGSSASNDSEYQNASFLATVPTNLHNQSVHNASAANATTLATIIWSQDASQTLQNLTSSALNLIFSDLQVSEDGICRRETSLLFLLLMLGTVWMAVSLFNFNKT